MRKAVADTRTPDTQGLILADNKHTLAPDGSGWPTWVRCSLGDPGIFVGWIGVGAVVFTALLFGLTHTGIFALLFGQIQFADLTWPWGVWTFFGSFVLSIANSLLD